MAEKVELIITADTSQYISGIREAQKATENLHNTATAGADNYKKSIKELEIEMDNLWKANKRGFSDVESMKTYEKKMEDLKKKHQELTTAEKDTAKATEEVSESASEAEGGFSKLGKGLGLVSAAFSLISAVAVGVIKALKDTEIGLNLTTTAGEFWRQMTYNIAKGNLNMKESFLNVAKVSKMMNDLRKEERKDLVEAAKKREEYNQLYFESSDRLLTDEQRLEKMNETMKVHNEFIDIELKNAQEQLDVVNQQLIGTKDANKLLDEKANLEANVIAIEGKRWSETKRLESQRTALEEKIHNDQIKAWHDEIEESNRLYDEKLKQQKAYQAIALKLIDEYDKSQIDSLEGKDKLEAQRKFGIKQIKELKDQIAKLGPVTAEQEKMLQGLADNVWKVYYEELAKLNVKPTTDQQAAISEALLGNIEELPGLVKKDVAKIQDEIANKVERNAQESADIWDIIGIDIDTEEGKEKVAAIQDAAGIIMDSIDDIYNKRVESAMRERELIEDQIATLERSLDLELGLMEEGYANNVSAKKKELEELEAQRQEALVAEQEALKKQQAYERISQTISLASTVANILKSFTSLGPWGLALAAIAIAAMWGIWSSQKSKIAGQTKLAEGGSGTDTGIITGKSHGAGGERFLDHVEVERGEAFGVLSREATGKYGKIFHEMVSSFNKDEMPDFVPAPISNSVKVENTGPNSRLDKVIKEQRKLNDAILKQSQQYSIGNKRVTKTGNNIRIVG